MVRTMKGSNIVRPPSKVPIAQAVWIGRSCTPISQWFTSRSRSKSKRYNPQSAPLYNILNGGATTSVPLMQLGCFHEAKELYSTAMSNAPLEEQRDALNSSRKAYAKRLWFDPMPNKLVFTMLNKNTRPAIPFKGLGLVTDRNQFWKFSGLAKLVRDSPGDNILHTTILQAMRIRHPLHCPHCHSWKWEAYICTSWTGSRLPTRRDVDADKSQRFQCIHSHGLVLRNLQRISRCIAELQPEAGWVCYVAGAPSDASHAFLHSTAPSYIFDPMQLAKDPAWGQNRYMYQMQFPTW